MQRRPRSCTQAELALIAEAVAAGRVTMCPPMAAAPTSAMPPERQAEMMDRVLAQWEADAPKRRDALRRMVSRIAAPYRGLPAPRILSIAS